jgi:hypothetical protein
MKCPACNKRLKCTKNKKRTPYLSVEFLGEFFKSLIYPFGIEDSVTCSQCAVKLVGYKSSGVAMRLGIQILIFGNIIYLTQHFLYGHKFSNIVWAIVIPFYVLAILFLLYSIVKLKNVKVSSEG